MLWLLRVYKDDRVVYALTLDKGESLADHLGLPPHRTDCRCVQDPDVFQYLGELFNLGRCIDSWTYEHGRISSIPIYPSPRKDT